MVSVLWVNERRIMKTSKALAVLLIILAMTCALACTSKAKAPDVSASIRQALEQAGLRDVSVNQDRDKSVVTLTGNVPTDNDKTQAESIARSIAGNQVVSNEIGVRPAGDESTAKKVDSDLDKGIDKNVDAALVQHKLNHDVRYDVKNGVVTLKGSVTSESQRATVEKLVVRVPNVKQVVNELEVKDQKATSTARNQ
jgi:hyperosmotically inducible periplasmic protein